MFWVEQNYYNFFKSKKSWNTKVQWINYRRRADSLSQPCKNHLDGKQNSASVLCGFRRFSRHHPFFILQKSQCCLCQYGSGPVCLPCVPLSVNDRPHSSRCRWNDRSAVEFRCSVPNPAHQDSPFSPSTFLGYVSPGSLVALLCWNVTCKYQSLALETSPNTAHPDADACRKCLSLPQYAQLRLAVRLFPSLPHRPASWMFAEATSLSFLTVSSPCFCKSDC